VRSDGDVEDDEDGRERGGGADPGRAVDVGSTRLAVIVPTLIAHAGAVGRSTHQQGAEAEAVGRAAPMITLARNARTSSTPLIDRQQG
jgi:hypothetical protein